MEAGLVPYSVKGFILSNVSDFLSNSFLLYVSKYNTENALLSCQNFILVSCVLVVALCVSNCCVVGT